MPFENDEGAQTEAGEADEGVRRIAAAEEARLVRKAQKAEAKTERARRAAEAALQAQHAAKQAQQAAKQAAEQVSELCRGVE